MHRPIVETRLAWPDEAACARCARGLAPRPELADAFIALAGTLGVGKTTFVRHLLGALGVEGRIKSPTYAVLETYEARGIAISHFDFYRFEDPREWDDAGFREIFAAPGLKLAEWPEAAGGLLPVPDLRIEIEAVDDTGRAVTLTAWTPRGVALAAACA